MKCKSLLAGILISLSLLVTGCGASGVEPMDADHVARPQEQASSTIAVKSDSPLASRET